MMQVPNVAEAQAVISWVTLAVQTSPVRRMVTRRRFCKATDVCLYADWEIGPFGHPASIHWSTASWRTLSFDDRGVAQSIISPWTGREGRDSA
jgi:hypothetical protein